MELKKQNILMFECSMDIGGSSKVVLQMCKELKDRVNKIVVCSKGGVVVGDLEKLGIKHYLIPDICILNPINALEIFGKLRKIIKNEKITVVHTHHRMAAMYANILSFSYKFVFFASVHGQFFDKVFLTKFAYKNALLIACGEKVKENLIDFFGIDKAKIEVLRNCVEKENTLVETDSTILKLRNKGLKIVAYIGRLSEEKGVMDLMESLKYFEESDKISFVIIGQGLLKEKMIEFAIKNNVLHRIHFLGYRTDVQNIINQVDCVVLPSLTEGLPLTPIETFANGKPVVATAVGGTPEIVVDGRNGILVASHKPKEIAFALRKLLNDNDMYKLMCLNAFEDYQMYYSMERFNEKLLSIYNEWIV